MTNMIASLMGYLPMMIVVWAVSTGLFLALLAYNGTITRYEENQLFLADINATEQERQSTIVTKVNRIVPFLRLFGGLAALMTIAIITIYTADAWQKM